MDTRFPPRSPRSDSSTDATHTVTRTSRYFAGALALLGALALSSTALADQPPQLPTPGKTKIVVKIDSHKVAIEADDDDDEDAAPPAKAAKPTAKKDDKADKADKKDDKADKAEKDKADKAEKAAVEEKVQKEDTPRGRAFLMLAEQMGLGTADMGKITLEQTVLS